MEFKVNKESAIHLIKKKLKVDKVSSIHVIAKNEVLRQQNVYHISDNKEWSLRQQRICLVCDKSDV